MPLIAIGFVQAKRKCIKEELRERYLSDCMEAYADELDALRNDAGFRGKQRKKPGNGVVWSSHSMAPLGRAD